MSIKSLKNLIFSLTDFEFLVSINSVDFEQKKVFIRKQFFNSLIGVIKKHVEIKSRSQINILVKNIKDIYIQRLALVSTHSFFRYFFKNIKIVFNSFSRRINRFFEQNIFNASTGPSKKQKKRNNKKKTVEKVPTQQQVQQPQLPLPESESEEELDRFGLPYHGKKFVPSESDESSNSETDGDEEQPFNLDEYEQDVEIELTDVSDSESNSSSQDNESDDEFTISGSGLVSDGVYTI